MTSVPDDPDAVDAAFDDIVSRIGETPSQEAWPAVEGSGPAGSTEPTAVPAPPSTTPTWIGWDDLRRPERPGAADEDDEPADDAADDEGHYVPPEPAPVPRGDARIRWAWAGALGAPVLAIVLPLLGWGLDGLAGIGLVLAFLVGFGYLISRLREEPPSDHDGGLPGGGPDDGAVI